MNSAPAKWAFVVGVLGLLLAPGTAFAQEEGGLGADDLVKILGGVFLVRAETMNDSVRFDACSVSRAFGGDTAVARRFLPWVQERFVGTAGPSCDRASSPRPRGQTRWGLRRVDVEHGYKVIVRAITYTPLGNYLEAWTIERDRPSVPDPYWGVREVVLSDFISSEEGLIIPPPPPDTKEPSPK